MNDWRDGFLVAALATLTIAWAVLNVASCAVTMPLDAVQPPPSQYQHDTTATVEFRDPNTVGLTCLMRGAVAANACEAANRITISNPCPYRAQHWLLAQYCHEMAHANGWPPDHSIPRNLPPASESPQARASESARPHGGLP